MQFFLEEFRGNGNLCFNSFILLRQAFAFNSLMQYQNPEKVKKRKKKQQKNKETCITTAAQKLASPLSSSSIFNVFLSVLSNCISATMLSKPINGVFSSTLVTKTPCSMDPDVISSIRLP